MEIYELIISCAPAVTAVASIIIAVTSVIKKITELRGEMKNLKSVVSTVNNENAQLKKELSKVYKLHSELVEHIYYKEGESNGEQANS